MPKKPTQKQLERLWSAVESWIKEYEPNCPESLMQVDSINEGLPELAEAVCNIVGFAKGD